MWVAYLGDQIYLDPEAGFLEQTVNIIYPLGDVIPLIAVMILATRRSVRRFDTRLIALSVGLLIVTVAADVIYLIRVENDSYLSGGVLDSLWLAGYAGVPRSTTVVPGYAQAPKRSKPNEPHGTGSSSLPYTAVVALFLLTLWRVGGKDRRCSNGPQLSSPSSSSGRQAVAIGLENRELVRAAQ